MDSEKRLHLRWIDVLKGIAIILVVMGHNVTDKSFIFSFHIPLFFLLSGFVFSPNTPKKYFHKSFLRLCIPYISFLVIISFPELVYSIIRGNISNVYRDKYINLIYGGELLKGPYAVFWFVSVLWMSTNLFNYFLYTKIGIRLLPILIVLGYLTTILPIPLPLNIHIVPLATSYIMIGYIIRINSEIIAEKALDKEWFLIVISILILMVVFFFRHDITIDMKYNIVGIPIVSIITSVLSSISVAYFAIIISRINVIAKIFAIFGEASMVIMFVHMPVKLIFMPNITSEDNAVLSIICGLTIGIASYLMLNKIKLTRCFFLGQNV